MTYLAIAGSATTPYYCSASNCTGGWGGGNGNYATATLSNQGNFGFTFFANSNTITTPVTGTYIIMGRAHGNMQNNSQMVGIRLLRNGSASVGQALGTTDAQAAPDSGAGNGHYGADIGFWCLVALNAGDSIQLQGYQSWGVTTCDLLMVFVPTPDHRK
jgi:hypothetical protein